MAAESFAASDRRIYDLSFETQELGKEARILWGGDESSCEVMHSNESGNGNPRAQRNQKHSLAQHPKRMSLAIFLTAQGDRPDKGSSSEIS